MELAAVGARAAGDRWLIGVVLANLGDTKANTQRFSEALDHLAEALTISRELSGRRLEGDPLGILGSVYRRLERDGEALEHLGQALAISRQTGDRRLEMDTRNTLGETLLSLDQAQLDDFDQARRHWHDPLAIYIELDVPDADRVRARLAALDESGPG